MGPRRFRRLSSAYPSAAASHISREIDKQEAVVAAVKLAGGVVFDDSRLNRSLVQTAVQTSSWTSSQTSPATEVGKVCLTDQAGTHGRAHGRAAFTWAHVIRSLFTCQST
jgi:hypothetical protein